MNPQPLNGITVLDFGQIYNGPYCGYLLAMSGARVIKVEPPDGETMRSSQDGDDEVYPFCMLNGNKEMITLNIKSSQGQSLLKQLIKEIDVLLENYAPGTMAKYGIGSEALREINPQLIYAAGTGFGQQGPHAHYLAMDITVQAMSGVVSITGRDTEPPLKSGPAVCDILGGVHLYSAIVSALYRRTVTREGAVLDVAMQDSVIPSLCSALGAYYRIGGDPPRTGNHHQAKAIAPYNIYRTIDGHVAIICMRDRHWLQLLSGMGREDMATDERFVTMQDRADNMEVVDDFVESWTKEKSSEDVFSICQAHGVVCAPVQSLSDVLNDPHLIARGALQKLNHSTFGEVMLPSTPLRFMDVDPPPCKLPRRLGADNERVYGEFLGLSDRDVQGLRDASSI